MNDTNEFAPDSPEIYAADAVLNGGGSAPSDNAPLPPTDDMDMEPSADVPPPVAPAAPAAPAATQAPAAAAPAAPVEFDRRAPIQGLREDANLSIEGIALATKEKLAKQPKVRMMIPLDPGEKAGAYRTVIINGYRFDVRKNTMVDLPEAVAALLSDAYRITSDVLENSPLNLNNADAEKRKALGVG